MEEIGESTVLDPKPGYVIKTRLLKSSNVQIGTKIFINVCHDPQVPKPPQDFDATVVFPLIVDNQWEIPIIVSREKEVKDKSGQTSLCYDCCINDNCFRWCTINSDLKLILNEWCLEAVELLYNVVLERQYLIPKMLSKGELSKTEIKQKDLTDDGLIKKLDDLKKNETLGLLEELHNDDMDVDIQLNPHPPKKLKKPLIEELPSEPRQPRNPIKPIAPVVEAKKVEYDVRMKKNQGKLIIIFKSNLPYENIGLYLDSDNIIISSTSTNFSLQEVKIPVQTKEIKSFYTSNTLYIFC